MQHVQHLQPCCIGRRHQLSQPPKPDGSRAARAGGIGVRFMEQRRAAAQAAVCSGGEAGVLERVRAHSSRAGQAA